MGSLQGKRFSVGYTYGLNLGGDLEGDLQEYNLDFRAANSSRTDRSWPSTSPGPTHVGQALTYYSLEVNQLRGFDFREFFGTRVVWTNVELRYPLVDLLQFPFMGLRSIRGFVFTDLGAAWFDDGSFYDPELGFGTIRHSPSFKFWDSDNDRLQDGRGSYGFGFQFLFLGGLQFNWAWSHRMDYTRYVCADVLCSSLVPVVRIPREANGLHIVFDGRPPSRAIGFLPPGLFST